MYKLINIQNCEIHKKKVKLKCSRCHSEEYIGPLCEHVHITITTWEGKEYCLRCFAKITNIKSSKNIILDSDTDHDKKMQYHNRPLITYAKETK